MTVLRPNARLYLVAVAQLKRHYIVCCITRSKSSEYSSAAIWRIMSYNKLYIEHKASCVAVVNDACSRLPVVIVVVVSGYGSLIFYEIKIRQKYHLRQATTDIIRGSSILSAQFGGTG